MQSNTQRTIRFFLKHMIRYKFLLTIMIFGIIAAPFASTAVTYLYKIFFDAIVSEKNVSELVLQLRSIILLILGLNMVQWVLWRICEFTNARFELKIMRNIIDECFAYLHDHSYGFFNNNFSGALIKKVNRLARAFETIIDKVYWDLIHLVVKIGFIVAVLFTIHVVLALSLLIWTFVFASFNYLFSLYKLKYDIARAKAETKVSAELADTMTNAVNIKLFTSLSYEIVRFKKKTIDWFLKARTEWNMGFIVNAIQAFFMIVIEFFMMYLGIYFWKAGTITVGDFVLIQAFLLEIFEKIWDFGRVIRDIYHNLADAEEMVEILYTPHEIKDRRGAKKLKVIHGRIEFKSVSFSYENEQEIIQNLSFIVKPGEKVGLIGPSGGGKSTIAKLMLRFFDINQGAIVIDGQNIAYVRQKSLRENISLVPQDPILFHRTLMENIRYGRRNASDREIIAVSKLARCHEFIMKHHGKYNTYVGERGVKLSGGQRQRVAIARAILKNAPILILDEATSSLDSHSEILIQEALQELMKNRTTIVIAHRLSTIMKMDRILVIDDGQVIEEGSHGELLKREESLYKKLWELQVGGYVGNR